MTICQRVREELDEYVHEMLSDANKRRIERHIATCERCETLVARARALTRDVQETLDEWGPSPQLENRVDAAIHAGRKKARGRVRTLRWSPAFAIVTLMAALGAFVIQHTSDPSLSGSLVSEFNTFVVSGRNLDYESASPDDVRAWFRDKVTFRPPVPGAAPGLSLEGARLCNIADMRVASYMYKVEGAWISLYIMRSDGEDNRANDNVDGYAVVDWTDDDLRYVLVGEVARARLRELARSMGRVLPPIS